VKHARAIGGRGASRPTHLASTWRTGRIGRAGHETLAWRAPRRRGRWGKASERDCWRGWARCASERRL
jgi:hypothetical protein